MADSQRLKDLLITLGAYRPARYLSDRLRYPDHARVLRRGIAIYSQFVRPGDLCFDIGANIGRKSEALLKIGARVVAAEPQPACAREIGAFFARNPDFHFVAKAVGREPGRAQLHLARDNELSSLKADWADQWSATVEVEVTTLDRLIDEFGIPRFCKIDVEGFELEVLDGLSRPIPYLSFEYNIRYPERTLECLRNLERFGIRRLNMTSVGDMQLLHDDWCDYATFLRRYREALERNPDAWGGDVYVECGPADA